MSALTFCFFFGYVPTGSMEPVLKEGSFLLGTRIYSTLDEGDIIVFRHEGRFLVKRIAAMPGETADWYGDMMDSYGDADWPELRQEAQEVKVPRDCYFVLGDNRGNSFDSRYWKHPFVEKDDIVAKVLLPDGQRGQTKK